MSDPRLFVALDVPSEVQRAVDAMAAPLRAVEERVAWVCPNGWHVTLAFLGNVPSERVEDVVEVAGAAVRQAAVAVLPDGRVHLSVGAPGSFGDRVAWLAVDADPDEAIAAMGEAVQIALEAADLPVDRKPVKPHLTLARGRRRLPRGFLDRLSPVEASWTVDRAVVLESILSRGPARYEEVASLPFGAP